MLKVHRSDRNPQTQLFLGKSTLLDNKNVLEVFRLKVNVGFRSGLYIAVRFKNDLKKLNNSKINISLFN
jgi:hypothetical protein